MLQRIRGEVLGLATAYVGIQGGLNQASGAVEAYKMRQQALVKISTVVGNSQEALNAEWQYMLGLSDKLGIDLGTLAQSYTKFCCFLRFSTLNHPIYHIAVDVAYFILGRF